MLRQLTRSALAVLVCVIALRGQGMRIAPNGRYFVDADGKPLTWIGGTAWNAVNKLTVAEFATYLAARKRQQFTAVALPAHYREMPNVFGQTPFTDGDFSHVNEPYWQHFDALLDTALQEGFTVILMPGWEFRFGSNPHGYGMFLGQRYRDRDKILWMYGGDVAVDNYVASQMTSGLRDAGDTHEVTFHPGGGGGPGNTSTTIAANGGEWLSAHATQVWCFYEYIPDAVGLLYQQSPSRPVLMVEAGYEAGCSDRGYEYVGPLQIRRGVMWSFMSGACCYIYGYYNPTGAKMCSFDGDWQSALNAPGAEGIATVRSLLEEGEWWKWIPDNDQITSGRGSGTHVKTAAYSDSGDRIVVYFADNTPAQVSLSRLGADPTSAAWYSPATGEERLITPPERSASPVTFDPPFDEDALLVLSTQGTVRATLHAPHPARGPAHAKSPTPLFDITGRRVATTGLRGHTAPRVLIGVGSGSGRHITSFVNPNSF